MLVGRDARLGSRLRGYHSVAPRPLTLCSRTTTKVVVFCYTV
jgi:hypothetical protein